MERKNAWAKYDEAGLAKIEAFAKDYCAFIDGGKTERECVALAVKAAKENGFADLFELVKEGRQLPQLGQTKGPMFSTLYLEKRTGLWHFGQAMPTAKKSSSLSKERAFSAAP